MDWADDVAYSVHDVEDGMLSGRIDLAALGSAGRAGGAGRAGRRGISAPASAGRSGRCCPRPRTGCSRCRWCTRCAASTPTRRRVAAHGALKRLTSELVGRFVRAAADATRAVHGDRPLRRYDRRPGGAAGGRGRGGAAQGGGAALRDERPAPAGHAGPPARAARRAGRRRCSPAPRGRAGPGVRRGLDGRTGRRRPAAGSCSTRSPCSPTSRPSPGTPPSPAPGSDPPDPAPPLRPRGAGRSRNEDGARPRAHRAHAPPTRSARAHRAHAPPHLRRGLHRAHAPPTGTGAGRTERTLRAPGRRRRTPPRRRAYLLSPVSAPPGVREPPPAVSNMRPARPGPGRAGAGPGDGIRLRSPPGPVRRVVDPDRPARTWMRPLEATSRVAGPLPLPPAGDPGPVSDGRTP